MTKLTNRLQLIANKVEKCEVVSDIGTDHAYVPVYLVKKGICKRAIAGDVKLGPLDAAKRTIGKMGLGNQIETRLGNGLEILKENEAQCIIIAGMGGELMVDILENGLSISKLAKQLVLQAMSSQDILREWLCSNGFNIYDEELTIEGKKIYNIICAKYDGIVKNYPIEYYEIGEFWIKRKDPLALKVIHKRLSELECALHGIEKMREIDSKKRDKLHTLYEKLNYTILLHKIV